MAGHFARSRLLVFCLGSFNHVLSELNVFLDGELAVMRTDITRVTESTRQRMDHQHRGAEGEIGEIYFRRDNLVVP
jgi:hypothetical protein